MLSYDKKIKESEFAPVKSAKKAKELQTLRQSLDPEFKKKRREMDREAAQTDRESELKKKNRKMIWHQKKKKPETPIPIEPPKDYLKEIIQDRRDRGYEPKNQVHNWEKDLRSSNLTKEQKYQLVQHKARELEIQAKKKEEMKNTANFGMEDQEKLAEEANDLYFESIQAKLGILNDYQTKKDEDSKKDK